MADRELPTVEAAVDAAIAAVGRHIVLAAPIGLGKPVQLMNAFYRRALAEPELSLTILTGLSLAKPPLGEGYEARLLGPFLERQFGDYEELDYVAAVAAGTLPSNVRVHEFYFRAGSMLGVGSAQRDYISTNYTNAARDLFERGANVLVQLVAAREIDGEPRLSLSCNTDLSLDLLPALAAKRARGERVFTIAQVHAQLPFMRNRAEIARTAFDAVVDNRDYDRRLFAPPYQAVSAVDFAIGLHASALLRDGGTLQIGIGSLGDAIVHACCLRQQSNALYAATIDALGTDADLVRRLGGTAPFERGLHGSSEMFVSGFLRLMQAGVLRRRVYDDARIQRIVNAREGNDRPDAALLAALCEQGHVGRALAAADVAWLRASGVFAADVLLDGDRLRRGAMDCPAVLDSPAAIARVAGLYCGERLAGGIVMRGGFFLGPADFYAALRALPQAELATIAMDSVRRINRIDDAELHPLQRLHARFVNTGMMVTLSGAVVSDGLEDGQVVSGVGGQFDFVEQAQQLPDARSIICVRATRESGGELRSTIVPRYGHVTVPRHMRDIVITEYGVAELRGRTDEEIVKALLRIADARFQDELLAAARAAGKIDPAFEIPAAWRANTPERLAGAMAAGRAQGCFPAYPLGCDFTDEEIELGRSLREIAALAARPVRMLGTVVRAFVNEVDEEQARPFLERIGLLHPDTPKDVVLRHLLLLELEERGVLRPL